MSMISGINFGKNSNIPLKSTGKENPSSGSQKFAGPPVNMLPIACGYAGKIETQYSFDQIDKYISDYLTVRNQVFSQLDLDFGTFEDMQIGLVIEKLPKGIGSFLNSNARGKLLNVLDTLFKNVYVYRIEKDRPVLEHLLQTLEDKKILDTEFLKYQMLAQNSEIEADDLRLILRYMAQTTEGGKANIFAEIENRIKQYYKNALYYYDGERSVESVGRKYSAFMSVLVWVLDGKDEKQLKKVSMQLSQIKSAVSITYLSNQEISYLKECSSNEILRNLINLQLNFEGAVYGSPERVKAFRKLCAAQDLVLAGGKISQNEIDFLFNWRWFSDPDKIDFESTNLEAAAIFGAIDTTRVVKDRVIRYIASKVQQRIYEYKVADDVDRKQSIETILNVYIQAAKEMGVSKDTIDGWLSALKMPDRSADFDLTSAIHNNDMVSVSANNLHPKIKQILKDLGLYDFAKQHVNRFVFIKNGKDSLALQSFVGGKSGGHATNINIITMSVNDDPSTYEIAMMLAHEIAHVKWGREHWNDKQLLRSVPNERNAYIYSIKVNEIVLKKLIAADPKITADKLIIAMDLVSSKILVKWCNDALDYADRNDLSFRTDLPANAKDLDLDVYPTKLDKIPVGFNFESEARKLLKAMGAK